MILARGELLELVDFELPGPATARSDAEPADERQSIEAALRAARGRVYGPDDAAASLGMAPSTLDFRIRRLGIDKFAFRAGRRN